MASGLPAFRTRIAGNLVFSVVLEGEIEVILSDSHAVLGHKARGNYVCELIETHF